MSEVWRRAMADAAGYRFAPLGGPALGKAGFHGSSLAGSSLEYKDFRHYQPGDDLRSLDWNAYARFDKLIVKRYHDEVMPHLDLVVDGSRSMDLPGTPKGDVVRYLTLFFALVARHSQFSSRVWWVTDAVRPVPGSENPAVLQCPAFTGAGSPASGLAALPPMLRRRGLRVLVTDTLWPDPPQQVLTGLCAGAAAVVVVRVAAASDLQPPEDGLVRLQDSETGTVHQVRVTEAVRARYAAALRRHTAAWDACTRGLGALTVALTAERLWAGAGFEDPAAFRLLQPC